MKIKQIIVLILILTSLIINCIDLSKDETERIFIGYGITKTDSTGNIIEDFGDWWPREENGNPYFYFIPPYPNPCKDGITIRYYLKIKADVELFVCYNAWPPKPNSTTIKYLVDCEQDTGYHEIYWDCTDKFGYDLPSGYYGIGLSFQIEGYASGVYGGSVQIIRQGC